MDDIAARERHARRARSSGPGIGIDACTGPLKRACLMGNEFNELISELPISAFPPSAATVQFALRLWQSATA